MLRLKTAGVSSYFFGCCVAGAITRKAWNTRTNSLDLHSCYGWKRQGCPAICLVVAWLVPSQEKHETHTQTALIWTHVMAERRWWGCSACAVETGPAFPGSGVQPIPLTVAAGGAVGAVFHGHVVLVRAKGAGRAGEGLSRWRAAGAVEPRGAGCGVHHWATCEYTHCVEAWNVVVGLLLYTKQCVCVLRASELVCVCVCGCVCACVCVCAHVC